MTYAHLFENPVSSADLPTELLVDLSELDVEQQAVVVAWLSSHVNQAAAATKLHEMLQHALFDLTAAELGAQLIGLGHA